MNKNTKTLVDIINDENTSGSVLLLLLYNLLGKDEEDLFAFLDWDPETVQFEIVTNLGVTIPEDNFNKLMAARDLVISDAFWTNLPDFITLCNSLASGTFDPRVFDIADIGEVAWAVTESVLLWPPEKSTAETFAPDILAYIREVAAAEGLTRIPAILKFAIPDDDKIWNQITAQFDDDPLMFKSIYELSVAKTVLIDNMLIERLDYMLEQMTKAGLPENSIGMVQRVRDLIEKHRVPE